MPDNPTLVPFTPPVNLLGESQAITDSYRNLRISAVNDHEIRMSVMTSGFDWHHHPDSDELFLGVDGQLVIELEDREIVLGPGELFTVPKGTLHRTRPATSRSVNITFERRDAATVFTKVPR